ncbi:hypothetical protein JTB14_035654 [Gonioctena quinquepunctata]|nr:hypothetical protein JTB14_035654 [Gonioctena quinquepunctata]
MNLISKQTKGFKCNSPSEKKLRMNDIKYFQKLVESRLPIDIYETAKVSKLLLMMEKGSIHIEYKGNTRKSFYAAHLAETKISTRNTRKSFNAAHLGGARACEAGFDPIHPGDTTSKKTTKKETINEERNHIKKTTKKENNEERNLQRRKKPPKKKETNKENGASQ